MKTILSVLSYFIVIVLTGLLIFGCEDPAGLFINTGVSAMVALILAASVVIVLIVIFMARAIKK